MRSKHDSSKNFTQSRLTHRSNMQYEPVFKMNPPKYSVSGLKKSMITPKDLTENTIGVKIKQTQYSNVKNEGHTPDLNKSVSIFSIF